MTLVSARHAEPIDCGEDYVAMHLNCGVVCIPPSLCFPLVLDLPADSKSNVSLLRPMSAFVHQPSRDSQCGKVSVMESITSQQDEQ